MALTSRIRNRWLAATVMENCTRSVSLLMSRMLNDMELSVVVFAASRSSRATVAGTLVTHPMVTLKVPPAAMAPESARMVSATGFVCTPADCQAIASPLEARQFAPLGRPPEKRRPRRGPRHADHKPLILRERDGVLVGGVAAPQRDRVRPERVANRRARGHDGHQRRRVERLGAGAEGGRGGRANFADDGSPK